MNEDCGVSKFRNRGGAEKAAAVVQYTAKDFQLEVPGKLAEVQNLGSLWTHRGTESLKQCGSSDF
jgi:hypothetical protein